MTIISTKDICTWLRCAMFSCQSRKDARFVGMILKNSAAFWRPEPSKSSHSILPNPYEFALRLNLTPSRALSWVVLSYLVSLDSFFLFEKCKLRLHFHEGWGATPLILSFSQSQLKTFGFELLLFFFSKNYSDHPLEGGGQSNFHEEMGLRPISEYIF